MQHKGRCHTYDDHNAKCHNDANHLNTRTSFTASFGREGILLTNTTGHRSRISPWGTATWVSSRAMYLLQTLIDLEGSTCNSHVALLHNRVDAHHGSVCAWKAFSESRQARCISASTAVHSFRTRLAMVRLQWPEGARSTAAERRCISAQQRRHRPCQDLSAELAVCCPNLVLVARGVAVFARGRSMLGHELAPAALLAGGRFRRLEAPRHALPAPSGAASHLLPGIAADTCLLHGVRHFALRACGAEEAAKLRHIDQHLIAVASQRLASQLLGPEDRVVDSHLLRWHRIHETWRGPLLHSLRVVGKEVADPLLQRWLAGVDHEVGKLIHVDLYALQHVQCLRHLCCNSAARHLGELIGRKVAGCTILWVACVAAIATIAVVRK
mmetsp:Transcript_33633/g.78605  ORF Transcript_33633/g.78605 Transcript_33633/m.78605 type:complete len:384 (+) Transcript_33633:2205-3356(+)